MNLITYTELKNLVPVSKTTLWRWENAGKFPRRIRLGARSIAWSLDEIHNWLSTRPRGMAVGN